MNDGTEEQAEKNGAVEPLFAVALNGDDSLRFYSLEDFIEWANVELQAWSKWVDYVQPRGTRGAKRAVRQRTLFQTSITHATNALKQDGQAKKQSIAAIVGQLSEIGNRKILLSNSFQGLRVLELHKLRPDLSLAAWSIETGCAGTVAREQEEPLLSELFQAVTYYAVPSWQQDLLVRADELLTSLESRTAQGQRLLGEILERAKIERGEQQAAHLKTVEGIESGWKDQAADINKDWGSLKRAFREDMKLKASRQYWEDKASRHKAYAVGWGIAFGLALTGSVIALLLWGVDWLAGSATLSSEVSSAQRGAGLEMLPRLLVVLLPAFAVIWLLRIAGRQLAGHLSLVEDANERSTMLLTFLALLSGEDHGGDLSEKDRILILHALFRPSAVSSQDDAPPAHWFDLLMERVGSAGRSGKP
ncbi:DUF6161 domain-containing protein [Marilutibacter alkalisoli]|uniref:DUF6161 domain-containing protein n=1 Tax=Marilutibacter alkalisoli TaxID=2591633 RepID=A0A514BVT6_9GAMM|nr:DUF6161 domain-containing protein [Lysobacter alkalisoli]QDH71159.1 hypothetical protein FKV23_14485 [Lysobacter alkalisoli]